MRTIAIAVLMVAAVGLGGRPALAQTADASRTYPVGFHPTIYLEHDRLEQARDLLGTRGLLVFTVLETIGVALDYFAQQRVVCPWPLVPARIVDLAAQRMTAIPPEERRLHTAPVEIILAALEGGCSVEPSPPPAEDDR